MQRKVAFVLTSLALGWVATIQAQYSGQQAPQQTGLSITGCSVFSDRDKNLRHDCTAKAKSLCSSAAPNRCELPIGLALTDGRDLDGDPNTWEKVVVRYRCGTADRVNGPHDQNDHASMVLECRGR